MFEWENVLHIIIVVMLLLNYYDDKAMDKRIKKIEKKLTHSYFMEDE